MNRWSITSKASDMMDGAPTTPPAWYDRWFTAIADALVDAMLQPFGWVLLLAIALFGAYQMRNPYFWDGRWMTDRRLWRRVARHLHMTRWSIGATWRALHDLFGPERSFRPEPEPTAEPETLPEKHEIDNHEELARSVDDFLDRTQLETPTDDEKIWPGFLKSENHAADPDDLDATLREFMRRQQLEFPSSEPIAEPPDTSWTVPTPPTSTGRSAG